MGKRKGRGKSRTETSEETNIVSVKSEREMDKEMKKRKGQFAKDIPDEHVKNMDEAIKQIVNKHGRPLEEKSIPVKLKVSNIVSLVNLIPKTDLALMELRYQLLRMVSKHGTDEQKAKIIL